MEGLFDTGISIEQMAAYLDGNLLPEEMENISSIIDCNKDLRGFIGKSNVIDDAISELEKSDLSLPAELQGDNFELPSLDVSDNEMNTSLIGIFDTQSDLMADGYLVADDSAFDGNGADTDEFFINNFLDNDKSDISTDDFGHSGEIDFDLF